MNLNTFARHGAFKEAGGTERVSALLRDRAEIQRARVFPYQLMAAYRNCDESVPKEVRNSLQDAMETALENVPAVMGKVYVCPDVSGSMRSPVTGYRKGASTAVQCVDVAALSWPPLSCIAIRRRDELQRSPAFIEVAPGRRAI
jgi:60 kDa SS-A/Ro ribonucleoprotein